MIVFACRTYSPNERKFASKAGAQMWHRRDANIKAQAAIEMKVWLARAGSEARSARHALAIGDNVTVTLIRFSRGELDDDNLRGALKQVRDAVAIELGVPNDADPRFTWVYQQSRRAHRPFGPYRGTAEHFVGIGLLPVIEEGGNRDNSAG